VGDADRRLSSDGSFVLERGKARRIDVNMLESTIAFMPDPFGYFTQMNLVSDPYLRPHTSQSYGFRCADGKRRTREQEDDPHNRKARQACGYPQSHAPAIGMERLELNPWSG